MTDLLKKLKRKDAQSETRIGTGAADANKATATASASPAAGDAAAQLPLQSSLGNAAVARSLAGQQGDAASAEAAAAAASAARGNPSLYKFKVVVPHAKPGQPGGWQETDPVTLYFFYWPRSAGFNWWSCTFVVGVPLENFAGPVDPAFAAVEAAYAADIAERSLLDGKQQWFGAVDFGPEFRKKMQEVLASEIKGARVKAY